MRCLRHNRWKVVCRAAVLAQVSVQPLATSVEWARRMVRRTQTGVGRSCAGCRARCELVESRMQRCVAIVWTRAGLPHDGCVDCDVCEYSVVDGLARYIVRILSYQRLTPQICTRSRETLCTRPTLAGTPNLTESLELVTLTDTAVQLYYSCRCIYVNRNSVTTFYVLQQ